MQPSKTYRSNLDGAVIVAAVSVDFAVVAGGIAVALVVHGFRRNPRFIPLNNDGVNLFGHAVPKISEIKQQGSRLRVTYDLR